MVRRGGVSAAGAAAATARGGPAAADGGGGGRLGCGAARTWAASELGFGVGESLRGSVVEVSRKSPKISLSSSSSP
eukprot:scaffold112626_cov21-Phaeocystis_antarctica.AAC.1